MEGGTNEYPDHKFLTDSDPSDENRTRSRAHLIAQIESSRRVTWMTYREGMTAATGACPTISAGEYAAKHNPFVFFTDIAGDPPSPQNRYCAEHTRPFDALEHDISTGHVADYVFITPNLCHDMHGHFTCPDSDFVGASDRWLAAVLPRLIAWSEAHFGVILLTWDQESPSLLPLGPDATDRTIPFFVIGYGVRRGASVSRYDHGSIVKSVERIFGLPILPSVRHIDDLSDMFLPRDFP
jgi:hypothetical protein